MSRDLCSLPRLRFSQRNVTQTALADRVIRAVEDARDELVDFAAQLVRIPTVNPPGQHYRECAQIIGRQLRQCQFDVDFLEPEQRPEHTKSNPRVNVIGVRPGRRRHPLVHLNGHFDVVPAGEGWTVAPFAGLVRDGRLYGRGSSDMKSGLAAAVFAAEGLRRAGVPLSGTIEVSGTVDEESGGHAGVGHLAETGRIAAKRTDYVIIPEPFGPRRICIGHRGVYWFKVTALGRSAHGSMPFRGSSAIDHMTVVLDKVRNELAQSLSRRITEMPVVPIEARRASINVNAISGGQANEESQTPCVADRCEAIFDRRFIVEETFEEARNEIVGLLDAAASEDDSRRYELTDLMVFHPTVTSQASPLVRTLEKSIFTILGKQAECVASPGTYDHKHVSRLAGIEHCVAYGPGRLELAHQPDEWCAVDDMVSSAKVLALTLLELVGRE